MLWISYPTTAAFSHFELPAHCEFIAAAPLDARVTIGIGIKQNGMEMVYQALKMVSDPRHPQYGQYWDWEQMVQHTHDLPRLKSTLGFLNDKGLTTEAISADSLWIVASMNFSQATDVFNTRCFTFACRALESSPESVEVRRCQSFDIPSELLEFVDLIGGLTEWPEPVFISSSKRPRLNKADSVPSYWPPGPYLDIMALKSYYNCDPASHVTSPFTTGSVFEVNAPTETYNPPDLSAFQGLSDLPLQPVTQFAGSGTVSIGCANWACIEPMLDVEMFLGIAPNTNFTYWTTNVIPVPPAGNTVLQWLVDLAATPNPPLIHSISWGPPESHLSASMASRMDQEFAKLCLRGLTFITSSGDDGVNYRAARNNPSACGLSPQYPAGSPWVTTVGGAFGPEYNISERTCQTNVPGYSATTTSGGGLSIWCVSLSLSLSFFFFFLPC